jgi:hypothetical protein
MSLSSRAYKVRRQSCCLTCLCGLAFAHWCSFAFGRPTLSAPTCIVGSISQDAIHLLNSLQSNAATIAALRLHGTVPNPTALLEMNDYLARIGHRPHDLDALNVLHVTGTKGKGSTSAFCDSLLRSLDRRSVRPRKDGEKMKVGQSRREAAEPRARTLTGELRLSTA